jgi:asparagine synthase (glutamine-hydrolysing)
MCGIVGFINCGNIEELKNAVSSLNHRGPDASNTFWFNLQNSGLGHTRLSIIDLSENGAQPMYHKESGNWIIFNGEIYNYLEIKKQLVNFGYHFNSNSDTEVLLLAYHKWKEKCLDHLNGMFSFCIFNENTQDVFIARDRLGIKPLYYWCKNNKLAFASEIKALLELGAYESQPDYIALQTPIHYQIHPYTGFKNIFKIPPGHYLKFNKDFGIIINNYWDLNITENYLPEHEAIEKLDELINDAVRLNMISDIPIGAMLSGGLDSSIICALMQQKINKPLNTFTIKFDKKDLKKQGNTDDSFYAKLLAEKCGFNHNEITLKPDISNLLEKITYHLDEPLADPSAINTYLISEMAKKNGISVLLNGMGVDEVFGGYNAYSACLKIDVLQKFFPKLIRKPIEQFLKKLPESSKNNSFKYIRWIKRLNKVASLNQFDRQALIKNSALNSEEFSNLFTNNITLKNSYYYQINNSIYSKNIGSYLTKMCYLDTKTYMTDHNLNYSDKSMMAASVEGRPALIDHRIVEFMFNLEPKLRIKGKNQKYILRKVAEKYLPKEIIYRPKAPFSAPLRGWLKNELKEMVSDLLSYESIKKRGIYNPEYVHKLIINNNSGLEDNSQLIWRLMVNEVWFRKFF